VGVEPFAVYAYTHALRADRNSDRAIIIYNIIYIKAENDKTILVLRFGILLPYINADSSTPNPCITLYRRRAFITLEESLRRRWIGQSTDRVCEARFPPPSTPAEDSEVRGIARSLSPSLFLAEFLDYRSQSSRYTVVGFTNRRSFGKLLRLPRRPLE